MFDFDGAQRVIASAQIQPARSRELRPRSLHITVIQLFGVLLNETEGVLRETSRRRHEQFTITRRLAQNAFVQLEAEWNRLANQLRIVIPAEGVAAARKRFRHLIHGGLSRN
jgi:deoxycytidine triphosphate deaminase